MWTGFVSTLPAAYEELYEVDKLGAFFDIIHQDPVLADVKLIAEPWDLGSGGYQVGNFPSQWSEWNGRYRDNIRSFWKGDGGTLPEFATRLCGSADLYEWSGRRPYSSINFITCHDGFNLHDLVSRSAARSRGPAISASNQRANWSRSKATRCSPKTTRQSPSIRTAGGGMSIRRATSLSPARSSSCIAPATPYSATAKLAVEPFSRPLPASALSQQ